MHPLFHLVHLLCGINTEKNPKSSADSASEQPRLFDKAFCSERV